MASTEVRGKTMGQNFKSFGKTVKTFFKGLVGDEAIDSVAADKFSGTIQRLAEKEASKVKRSNKSSISAKNPTIERIEPDSPYHNIEENHDDLEL